VIRTRRSVAACASCRTPNWTSAISTSTEILIAPINVLLLAISASSALLPNSDGAFDFAAFPILIAIQTTGVFSGEPLRCHVVVLVSRFVRGYRTSWSRKHVAGEVFPCCATVRGYRKVWGYPVIQHRHFTYSPVSKTSVQVSTRLMHRSRTIRVSTKAKELSRQGTFRLAPFIPSPLNPTKLEYGCEMRIGGIVDTRKSGAYG